MTIRELTTNKQVDGVGRHCFHTTTITTNKCSYSSHNNDNQNNKNCNNNNMSSSVVIRSSILRKCTRHQQQQDHHHNQDQEHQHQQKQKPQQQQQRPAYTSNHNNQNGTLVSGPSPLRALPDHDNHPCQQSLPANSTCTAIKCVVQHEEAPTAQWSVRSEGPLEGLARPSQHLDTTSITTKSSQRSLLEELASNKRAKMMPWTLAILVYCLVSFAYQPPQSQQLYGLSSQSPGRSLFVLVEASLYQPDDGLTILDAANFDKEITQLRQPFLHVKLVEFYVNYCRYCRQFKTTMVQFARGIHSWRTVLRVGAVDLADKSNTFIAGRWSITGVPTLKMYPPPGERLAKELLETTTSGPGSQEMIAKYNQSVKVDTLANELQHYKNSAENLEMDTLKYLDQYVRRAHQQGTLEEQIPRTWPNLLAVQESSLADLSSHHQRPELFLIVDPGSKETSMRGLKIILELSSSAAFKAVRHVYAGENGQLLQDLIQQKENQLKFFKSKLMAINNNNADDNNGNRKSDDEIAKMESDSSRLKQAVAGGDQLILVHIEKQGQNASILNVLSLDQLLSATRSANNEKGRRRKRFAKDEAKSLIDSVATYVKQTYTETEEDLAFAEALKQYDEADRNQADKSKLDKLQYLLDKYLRLSSQLPTGQADKSRDGQQKYVRSNKAIQSSSSSDPDTLKDRADMNKAIRYLLFNEVQRQATHEQSPQQQQEKLDTLTNLLWIIKSYFPFGDDSSAQFIHGVHEYLTRQQQLLSASPLATFDVRDLRAEMKRLESEDKRLPQVKEWHYCREESTGIHGYPCALWRLFHTLVSFEYWKNQLLINQQQQQQQQQQLQSNNQKDPSSSGLTLTSGTSGNNEQQDESESHQSMKMAVISNRLDGGPSGGGGGGAIVESSSGSTTTSLSLTVDNTAYNSPPQYTGPMNGMSDKSIVGSGHDLNNNMPPPVLLVMRDYIRLFFSCSDCARHFEQETSDLNLDRIRRQEANNFSLLWLWKAHNRVNKRLSQDPATNDPQYPKVAYPTYDLCPDCYKTVPKYVNESLGVTRSFDETIDWNEPEVVKFLLDEYTTMPFSSWTEGFGYGPNSQYLILGLIMLVMVPVALMLAYVIVRRHNEMKQRQYADGTINGHVPLDERQL